MKAPLVIKDLHVGYDQAEGARAEVLRGVSLELRAGEIVGLVGEGGAGKTSLLDAVVDLLPRDASMSGEIEIFGRDVLSLTERERQAVRGVEIGTIVAGGRSRLNPMARIGDQIANVLRDHGATKAEAKERTLELLGDVGIPDPKRRARAYPHELSGGMAQRIVIAIAIACSPRLIIADEPTRGLDVTIAADILDLIERLIVEGGATALIATRDLGVVAQYCTRTIVLDRGTIIEDASVPTFFAEPESAYGRELLAAEVEAIRGPVTAVEAEPITE